MKLASEAETNETLVALDGLLWEGSTLSVRQATTAVDENPSRSQRLGRRREAKDEHEEHPAFKGRLRMDEEDEERRRKRKRPIENTRDLKIRLGTEDDWRKRREAYWGL